MNTTFPARFGLVLNISHIQYLLSDLKYVGFGGWEEKKPQKTVLSYLCICTTPDVATSKSLYDDRCGGCVLKWPDRCQNNTVGAEKMSV